MKNGDVERQTDDVIFVAMRHHPVRNMVGNFGRFQCWEAVLPDSSSEGFRTGPPRSATHTTAHLHFDGRKIHERKRDFTRRKRAARERKTQASQRNDGKSVKGTEAVRGRKCNVSQKGKRWFEKEKKATRKRDEGGSPPENKRSARRRWGKREEDAEDFADAMRKTMGEKRENFRMTPAERLNIPCSSGTAHRCLSPHTPSRAPESRAKRRREVWEHRRDTTSYGISHTKDVRGHDGVWRRHIGIYSTSDCRTRRR